MVEKAPNSQITDIDKRKFLVPSDISVAQFMWIIRRRIQVPSEKAIFLFVGKVLPQSRYRHFLNPLFFSLFVEDYRTYRYVGINLFGSVMYT